MSRLLHISSSPRGGASESLWLADAFLSTYRQVHPGGDVDHFDLWDSTLPEFGPAATGAKMAVFAGEEPVGEQAEAWEAVKATFARFDAAEHYLFSVPMWNSGVPYVLKQFIDVVSQPGLLFGFAPESGYEGLLKGKKAAVIYTGAVWGPGLGPEFGSDFQQPFFEGWLRWAGVEDVTTVRFQPNLVTADAADAREKARESARKAATTF